MARNQLALRLRRRGNFVAWQTRPNREGKRHDLRERKKGRDAQNQFLQGYAFQRHMKDPTTGELSVVGTGSYQPGTIVDIERSQAARFVEICAAVYVSGQEEISAVEPE